jgi:hypothetical protein
MAETLIEELEILIGSREAATRLLWCGLDEFIWT